MAEETPAEHGLRMSLSSSPSSPLALLLLLGFQRLPVAQHLARRVGLHIAEHVGMPVHQLVRQPVEHVVDGEALLFRRHLGVEEHLQQQVAKLAGQLVPVARVDGLQHFVGFFQRVGLDGVEGLLAVPGTSAGAAQPRHDGHGALKSFACGGHHNQSK